MKYITIINSDVFSTISDRKIISSDELHYFSSISDMANKLETIVSTRQVEVENASKAGYEEGYNKGLENGLQELKEKFNQFLKATYEKLDNYQSQVQKIAIELACEMTKKVAEDISKDELIRSITKTALLKVGDYPFYEIIVNESNSIILQDGVESMASAKQLPAKSIRIIVDNSLGDFDCHIRTNAGTTIASFDDQIDLLRNHIVTRLNAISPHS